MVAGHHPRHPQNHIDKILLKYGWRAMTLVGPPTAPNNV